MLNDLDNEEFKLSKLFERRAREFDDLQNELSGRETGRAARFLSDRVRDARYGGDSRAADDELVLSSLQMLLANDPAYAALYSDTFDALTEAENATEIALEKALVRQRAADEELAEIRAVAMTLDDGRRVYRDASGIFRFEDGSAASELGGSAEHWRPGMPGYEKFVASRDAAESAAETVSEIMHYQVDVLGNARERLTDQDNPLSTDELQGMNAQIRDEMPDQVSLELEGASQTPIEPTVIGLDIPKL